MSMSSYQDQVLRQISEQLASSDPRLARRLSEQVQPPTSTLRELAVMAVLLGWAVLGFLPLAIGIVSARPIVEGVGVLTMLIGAPLLSMATLWWVHRHRFVRFRGSGPLPRSPEAPPEGAFIAARRRREER